MLNHISLQQKLTSISTKNLSDYNKKYLCFHSNLKSGYETIFFATSAFTTKITNYYNKNIKLLQQKPYFTTIKKVVRQHFLLQSHLPQKSATTSTKNRDDYNKKKHMPTMYATSMNIGANKLVTNAKKCCNISCVFSQQTRATSVQVSKKATLKQSRNKT